MYTCASCGRHACNEENPENLPQNCPIRNQPVLDDCHAQYALAENHDFYITSCVIESEGYCVWPRLREIIEFCKKMGYTKIGLAFCMGLRSEAKKLAAIMRRHDLELVSVVCKVGGRAKESVGVAQKDKLEPDAFEAMCNPIAQAAFLNAQKTQFNVVLGLCVGHDSLFYKYAEAMTTTLVTKDRVLAHNPAGALYCADSYFSEKL